MSPGAARPPGPAPRTDVRDVARLALPAVLSYVLNNAYRINDQYWVQGLGGAAQAALGASAFVLILHFSVVFLAVAGTLSLVARATGAADRELRDATVGQALSIVLAIGAVSALVLPARIPDVAALLGLEGAAAGAMTEYLGTLFLLTALVVAPTVVDAAMVGMGNTLLPMLLMLLALLVNFVLNPVLIYGPEAAELGMPLAGPAGAVAERLGIEGRGMAGAALATGIARAVSSAVGLVLLRTVFGVHFARHLVPDLRRVASIARVGAPMAASIAFFALVYFALLRLVVTPLGDPVVAGLGLGFQVFEGVSFPCFLGISIACASLVGRSLGARDPDAAWRAVRSARRIGLGTGLAMTALFWAAARWLVPAFTDDPAVALETREYVFVLAFSQVFVAYEAVHEKTLVGAGTTRPALWISATGNALRVPLAWCLAGPAGLGSAGVWWAITATTALKATLLTAVVGRGRWIEQALADPDTGAPRAPAADADPRADGGVPVDEAGAGASRGLAE